jgi:hypothetical protein
MDVNDSGQILVADTGNDRIQVFSPDGVFLRAWSLPEWKSDATPLKIATGPNGRVHVLMSSDYPQPRNHYVQVFNENDELVGTWGSEGTGPGQFRWPSGIDVGLDGIVYISDLENENVQRFSPEGELIGVIPAHSLELKYQYLEDVAVAPNGFIYTSSRECALSEFWYAGTMVHTSDPALEFYADGERYVGSMVFRWPAGSTHEISTATPQFPSTGVRYDFADWDGSTAISEIVTAADPPLAHTASFPRSYRLEYEVEGGGEVSPPAGWYPEHAQLQLVPAPSAHYQLSEWVGEGDGSYTGFEQSPIVQMNEPISQRAIFRKHGFDFTISASNTDPFAVSATPTGGNRRLYLWLTCADRGLSAFEADVSGSLERLAFSPAPGVLNVYNENKLFLAIANCPTGRDTNVLLGCWMVEDHGGDLCLAPSEASGWIAAVDCHGNDPGTWEDPRVFCFSSNGVPAVIGSNGCAEGGVPIHQAVVLGRPPVTAPELPDGGTELDPVWPNPVAGRAEIAFSLESPGRTRLVIYDVAGRLVRTIVDGDIEAGEHRTGWDGRDAGGSSASGIYFARLETPGFTQTRKIIYLRER